MSVLSVGEKADSGSGGYSIGDQTLQRKFVVQMSSVNDGVQTAVNAAGIPRLFFTYQFGTEFNLDLIVRSVNAERAAAGSTVWYVTVDYGKRDEKEDQDDPENPLADLPSIEMGFETKTVVIEGDKEDKSLSKKFGKAIKNSAGETFDPPPVKPQSLQTLSIGRNEDLNSPVATRAKDFHNTVNSDNFFGFDVGTVLLRGISASLSHKDNQIEGGGTERVKFISVSYNFLIDRDGFDLELMDKGSYYLVGTTETPFEAKGQPVIGRLDGAGGKIADKATPDEFLPPIEIYERKAFGPLQLPQSFKEARSNGI